MWAYLLQQHVKDKNESQFLMGDSNISITINVYTHLWFDDSKDEMLRLEELNPAKMEVEKVAGEKPISYKMFTAI